MGNYAFKLDMTMMFAMHDALRRELDRITRITARVDEDPRHVLSTAVGWELFKKFLQIHHRSEDKALWPVLEEGLAGHTSELALLADMEAEHALIDPLLDQIDAALADRESGLERLHGLVDTLRMGLASHLRHEEADALILMDQTLAPEDWAAFSDDQRGAVGSDSVRYLPWLLDDIDAVRVEGVLGKMPAPLRAAYENEWRAAYQALDIWGPAARDTAG